MNQQNGVSNEAFAVVLWRAKGGVMNGEGVKGVAALELKLSDPDCLLLW